jgi:hypothetical protein
MKEHVMNFAEKFSIDNRRETIRFNRSVLETTLNQSEGQPIMSTEALKLAILTLKGMVVAQGELIEQLYAYHMENEARTWWQRLFNR